MEQIDNTLNIVEGLKDKLTSKEYKDLMDSLGEIHKIKKEVYVKVLRISHVTYIYHQAKEDEDGCVDSHISDVRGTEAGWGYLMCPENCECGECNRYPLVAVEVRSKMIQEKISMKVDEDNLHYVDKECIGRGNFERLKRDKTLTTGIGDILVYLEDNE